MKEGDYFYERSGTNFGVYVVEKVLPPPSDDPRRGISIHSRKIETHFDPETARRRVYELNGWKNYKPLRSYARKATT